MAFTNWHARQSPAYEMIPASHLKAHNNQNGLKSSLIEQINLDGGAAVLQDHEQRPLGRPSEKRLLDKVDVVATLTSISALLVGILVVANERLSWQLSTGTYQLVTIGFLLSIMNICLTSISPSFFLILEARFGPSTLQNYEGLLTNHIFKSQMSMIWRSVLTFMLLLPLGLSVAYKAFLGGYSEMLVKPHDYVGNSSYYGLFAIPGSGNLGRKSGVSMFANATLPFLETISADQVEPALPSSIQAYGFNHLLLDEKTAAFLDIPQPDYITAVQQRLRPGESWRVVASATGTVATFNTSNPTAWATERCNEIMSGDVDWGWWYFEALRNVVRDVASESGTVLEEIRPFINLGLMNLPAVEGGETLNFSALWLGFAYGLDSSYLDCSSYLSNMYQFTVARRPCKGTWLYTRTTVRLLEGSCEDVDLPSEQQLIITQSPLIIGRWYMASYCEMLGLYSWDKNTSHWKIPAFVTAVAASVWSRSYALSGADQPDSGDPRVEQLKTYDLGNVYEVSDQVTYIRPTMRKSALLYLILAVQPLLCVAMVTTKRLLYTTPIDRGFGLTSILSGLDVRNLEYLRGAALSGELGKEVKIVISPRKAASGDEIDYKISVNSDNVRNGKLRRRAVYR